HQRGPWFRRIVAQRVGDVDANAGGTHVRRTAPAQRAGLGLEVSLHRDAAFELDLLRSERDEHAAEIVALLVASFDRGTWHAAGHALHIGEAFDDFVRPAWN